MCDGRSSLVGAMINWHDSAACACRQASSNWLGVETRVAPAELPPSNRGRAGTGLPSLQN
eukprot:6461323-Amphidinium_carterae.2